jgi:prophage maintenance system killer protein
LEEVQDIALLQSALYRAKNLLAYSESTPEIASLAAAYGYGIIKYHPLRKNIGSVSLWLTINSQKKN